MRGPGAGVGGARERKEMGEVLGGVSPLESPVNLCYKPTLFTKASVLFYAGKEDCDICGGGLQGVVSERPHGRDGQWSWGTRGGGGGAELRNIWKQYP